MFYRLFVVSKRKRSKIRGVFPYELHQADARPTRPAGPDGRRNNAADCACIAGDMTYILKFFTGWEELHLVCGDRLITERQTKTQSRNQGRDEESLVAYCRSHRRVGMRLVDKKSGNSRASPRIGFRQYSGFQLLCVLTERFVSDDLGNMSQASPCQGKRRRGIAADAAKKELQECTASIAHGELLSTGISKAL
jgi:hypothetical protein